MQAFVSGLVRPLRIALVCATALASSAAFAPVGSAGPSALDLTGDYRGSYVQDGTVSARSMEIRVEQQRKAKIKKARIFATDLSEYIGKGRLAKDNATARIALRTSGGGRYVSHMTLATQITDAGKTLSGTYEITARGVATRTGTFTVAR